MPLFLKSLDTTLDIFGNEQTLSYNSDQLNNDANLLLLNNFTATASVFPSINLSFASTSLKGFQFQHQLTASSVYGNFALQTYDKFGTSSNIFKYNEATDSLNFSKPILISKISGLSDPTSSTDVATKNYVDTNVLNFVACVSTANIGSITTATISAIDGYTLVANDLFLAAGQTTASENGLYTYQAGASTKLAIQPKQAYIINGTVNANKIYTKNSNNWKSQFPPQNTIMHGAVSTDYTTNVATNDHIKFDTALYSQTQGLISLDTTATYTSTANLASVGRITLTANVTYKLVGSVSNASTSALSGIMWYNADTTTGIGLAAPITNTTTQPSFPMAIAYFKPSVNTRVELRILNNALSTVRGQNNILGSAWFTVEAVY